MIAVILFTIINLLWIALAAYLVVRLPHCKAIPYAGKVFIMLLFVLQIINTAFTLFQTLTKENIIRDVTNVKSKIDSNKTTLGSLNSLLMSDFWHQILNLLIMIVLYYIIFRTIYSCEQSVIPSNLVWGFLIVTVLKYGIVSIVKPSVDNKMMLHALAN